MGSTDAIERTLDFLPKFDSSGLLPVVTTDAKTGDVLMVATMNAEALDRTLATGIAHYWSRSRQRIWKKGETSGNLHRVLEARTDCDQDALWLRVETQGAGATCHTGQRSCFYRSVPLGGQAAGAQLTGTGEVPMYDPDMVATGDK